MAQRRLSCSRGPATGRPAADLGRLPQNAYGRAATAGPRWRPPGMPR